MVKTITKKIETGGKKILKWILRIVLPSPQTSIPPVESFNKILVLRLDQRIGNGLMLLPLLQAIRNRLPDSELHLLMHYPVAETIRMYSKNLIDQFWPYHQKKLLNNPIRFFRWVTDLRAEQFDLIISSHNPDNFSLSQALLGRWCSPGILAGFRWGDSRDFYDVAINSSANKHYASSQLDLWRYFAPDVSVEGSVLNVPEEQITALYRRLNLEHVHNGVLFWIGATGKKVMSPETIDFIYKETVQIFNSSTVVALGPADHYMMAELSSDLCSKILIWDQPLPDTAAFFAGQKVFISADTGPAHLAAALGLPMLTVFLSSRSSQYGYHDGISRFSIDYENTPDIHGKIHEYLMKLESFIHENQS